MLKLDIGEDTLREMDRCLECGMKPVLKMTREQVQRTVDGAGVVPFNLTPSQLERIKVRAFKRQPLKMTMTAAQARKAERSGGFFAAAMPLIGAAAKALAPTLGKAALGGLASAGTNKLANRLFGSGLNLAPPMRVGSGLYLRPAAGGGRRQGGGGSVPFDVIGVLEDTADHAIPLTRKVLGKLIEHVGKATPVAKGKSALDNIEGKVLSLIRTGNGYKLRYDGQEVPISDTDMRSGGFIGSVVKGIGKMLGF